MTLPEPMVVQLPRPSRLAMHGLGLGALAASALVKRVRGYRKPRPFSPADVDRAVAYDWNVVDEWLVHLRDYCGNDFTPAGREILELGPGPDLGTGIILLALGARRYTALDVNRLAGAGARAVHEALLAQPVVAAARLESALIDRLRYIRDPRFDPVDAMRQPADLVVSQAAFEHFENVPWLIERLRAATRPGAVLCAQIDLETHTNVLRGRDPLNIYRFSDRTYRMFRYPGVPNRIRPHEYAALLAANGWTDVRIHPLKRLAEASVRRIAPTLAPRFRDPEIGLLGVMLLARRRDG